MDRRKALKNMGLGAGFLVAGPTTLSLLQSCVNEPQYDWEPVFLTGANGFALKEVLDVILPTTDTPGANDLNIANFIDSYMNEVVSKEQQEEFTNSANSFARAFEVQYDKNLSEGTKEDFEKIVSKYLRATPEEREEYFTRTTETQDPMDETQEDKISDDAGAYSYLQSVRDLGIWAWKNSEAVGENVLWYDPIPGQWIPCGSVEDLGNGRAMAL